MGIDILGYCCTCHAPLVCKAEWLTRECFYCAGVARVVRVARQEALERAVPVKAVRVDLAIRQRPLGASYV